MDMTVREMKLLNVWHNYQEESNMNPWAENEGQVDPNDIISFDVDMARRIGLAPQQIQTRGW